MKRRRQIGFLIIVLILPAIFVTAAAGAGKQSPSSPLVCGVDGWDYEVLTDFETDDGGFVANTPPGEWEWGMPTPPPAAHSGSKVWATNLSGNITKEPSRHRLTKTLSLATFSAGQLQWWDWWDEDGTDQGRVLINGEEVYFVDKDQLAWTVHTVDLTRWQGQTVDIVFEHFSYPSGEGGPGWYLDDVALQTCDPTPTPDLRFSRLSAPATAVAGVPINTTIHVFNSGAQDAVDSSVLSLLPAESSYIAGSATNGAVYRADSHAIEWKGTVPAGQTVDIAFQMTSSSAGVLSNVTNLDHSSLSEPLILTAETQIAVAPKYPTCEEFEEGSGTLPESMLAETTTNSTATGRVAVTADYPFAGQYALNLDTDCGGLCGVGTFTRQAAILAANLAGQSQVELNFQVLNHGEESDPQDGVFISDDSGLTYTKIFDFSDLPPRYYQVIINLSQAAAEVGLTLNEGFLIKFQSFDNDKIAVDGLSFDQICLQRLNQPELTIDPLHLSSVQTPNTEKQRPLTLRNSGGGALTWQLIEAGTTVQVQGSMFEETAAVRPHDSFPGALPELAVLEGDEAPLLVRRTRDDLLYDQSDSVTTLRGVNSQKYEAAYVTFDSQAADDFTVPAADGSWTVRAVEAFGAYKDVNGSKGFAPAVNVYFYADDNGLPGPAVYTAEGLPPTFDFDGTFQVELPMPALLAPGTYWFSLQADMDASSGGQWYWYERTKQSGSEFAWRNPGGGFDAGCLKWDSGSACGFDQPDLGFRLAGSRDDCRPQDINWIVLPQTKGTVNGDSEAVIPVVFDSGGLPIDDYAGELCLVSNDPARPVSQISLEMTVQETAEFAVFLPVLIE